MRLMGPDAKHRPFYSTRTLHRQYRDAWLICADLLGLMRCGRLRWRLMFTLRSTIASMRSD